MKTFIHNFKTPLRCGRTLSNLFFLLWQLPIGDSETDIFEKNSTYVEIPTPMDKSEQNDTRMPADEVLRQLIKGDSEYILINKELILEKYRLVSLEELEEQKKESQRKHDEILKDLEERKNQIHGLYKIISEIASKIPDSNKPVLDKAK